MGFLHKLWDETLAGPAPETGLGKLRKYDSFSVTRSRPIDSDHHHRDLMITRSITILRSNSDVKNLSMDHPESPSGSTTPRTPLSPGTPTWDFKRFTRRKFPTVEDGNERAEPRSPTVYDWIVISALDR